MRKLWGAPDRERPRRRATSPAVGGSTPRASTLRHRVATLGTAFCVLAVGCSLSADGTATSSRANLIRSRAATGWLTVDGSEPLDFQTTTCSADPDRFVAVGRGMAGDVKFLVRVRARNVLELRYGTHDELEADSREVRQLVPTQPPTIVATQGTISASASLVDTTMPERQPVKVVLRVYCGQPDAAPAAEATPGR